MVIEKMETGQFEEYVKTRYEKELRWYDRKSTKYKDLYLVLQGSAIALAAVTPVLISLDRKTASLSTSLAVAILTATLKIFKLQENWINYRTTCETLKKEIYFYNALVGDYLNTTDREALFVERVESVISRENTLWLRTFSKEQRKNR